VQFVDWSTSSIVETAVSVDSRDFSPSFLCEQLLQSLLLEGESATPFKFCYNFYGGEVNRDRQRLSSPREEAQALAKIWGEAVRLELMIQPRAGGGETGMAGRQPDRWRYGNLTLSYCLFRLGSTSLKPPSLTTSFQTSLENGTFNDVGPVMQHGRI
jgi:hypothetical protein